MLTDGDNDVAEKSRCAFDEIEMAQRRGIEAASIDGEPRDGLVRHSRRAAAGGEPSPGSPAGAGGEEETPGGEGLLMSVGSGSTQMNRPSSSNVTRKNASRSAPTIPAKSTP